tara:strand:+ start:6670 stop:6813 length:144 start_codon:yes stop_codon:yes gene_type:complete
MLVWISILPVKKRQKKASYISWLNKFDYHQACREKGEFEKKSGKGTL